MIVHRSEQFLQMFHQGILLLAKRRRKSGREHLHRVAQLFAGNAKFVQRGDVFEISRGRGQKRGEELFQTLPRHRAKARFAPLPFVSPANALQQFAQAGVKLEIIPGDGKQTLTKYRARQHDIYIGRWGADYQDPNSNADTFAANDDNSDDAKAKPLAWRNAWDPGPLTAQTRAAVLEPDAEKRAKMYEDLQKEVLAKGPYIGMFQQIEVMAMRKNVDGMIIGPSFDTNSVAQVRKN